MFLHLFVSSLISLSSGLQFSLKRSCRFLVSCIPRYFILFVAIVNGSSFLIWLSLSLLLMYRNACNFCTLILYPETLLKLCISFRRFWPEIMESSRYTIMSSENIDRLTSSFSIWIYFISFFCLIALARTSNNILNRSSEPYRLLKSKMLSLSIWIRKFLIIGNYFVNSKTVRTIYGHYSLDTSNIFTLLWQSKISSDCANFFLG